VRDVRNPIVTCVVEPTSGHETEDPDWTAPTSLPRQVAVVGGGVAGMELARVAAARGHRVRLVERSDRLGGMAGVAGPHQPLVAWLRSTLADLPSVSVELGVEVTDASELDADVVVQCTGGQAGYVEHQLGVGVRESGAYTDVGTLRAGGAVLPDRGDVVLADPIGGPIAVALAEELGARAILVTPDHVAGNELSRTGDLAPANTRLAQGGVRVERRCIVRAVHLAPVGGDDQLHVELADRFAVGVRTIGCAAFVDCGFRLPDPPLRGAAAQAGDCVAPRTVHEAILDARRIALSL
jgi:NADPH-dependent 2,4-dienoyl-CoA reductase/sulfur reductase-like enzyme